MNDKIQLIELSIEKIQSSKNRYENFLASNKFISVDKYENFKSNNPIEKKLNNSFSLNLKQIKKYNEYNRMYKNYISYINKFDDEIDRKNKEYYDNRSLFFKANCKTVENHELDKFQINSIVHEDRNQLVVAGAGCGKTTTIIGKVKYLLKSGFAKPEEILLLSFTNASSTEMGERIKKELKIDTFDSYTFHKLGLEIIKQALNKDVKIYKGSLNNFIKDQIDILVKDKEYLNKLILFFSNYIYDAKDEFEFTNEEEYEEYLKLNPPTTLKGEVVKSYGELEIANFLFMNNIDYVYEGQYEKETRTQYNPDFHILNTNIYIEYFGINQKGQVPSYFKGKDNKTPSELYNEGIKWKKRVHKQNDTKLIDLYYYDKQNEELLEKLEEKLIKNGIKLNPKSQDEIWEETKKNNNGIVNEIARTFETVINLIKSNDYSFMDVIRLAKKTDGRGSVENTLMLIEPIFGSYNQELKRTNSIDFNDMINLATKCVNDNKYIHNYKYVIVDEYQDMSKSRYNLLKSLRDKKDYSLFCVGDDWQSIYRFSGSDLDLIVNFEKYFGKTYISTIEKTYRFSQKLADISQEFIMKNPNQIKKFITGNEEDSFPIDVVQAYKDFYGLQFIEEKLNNFEQNSTVYFLGRYNFDIDIFKDNKKFSVKYNNQTGFADIVYRNRKDLKINFFTIHKSKGLQADYVILINNKRKGMGFPSKLNDIPAIRILLSDCEGYPFSEERRLFYVALTRCKKKIILLTIKDNVSVFAEELIKKYNKEIKRENWKCPQCKTGTLVKRTGKYGEFFRMF